MSVAIGLVALAAEFARHLHLVRERAREDDVDRLSVTPHPLGQRKAAVVLSELSIGNQYIHVLASEERGARLCAADDFDHRKAAAADMLSDGKPNDDVCFHEKDGNAMLDAR